MALCQLIIPAEAAHQSISLVGEVGLFQFKDLNKEKSAFQRTYANQVRGSELPHAVFRLGLAESSRRAHTHAPPT